MTDIESIDISKTKETAATPDSMATTTTTTTTIPHSSLEQGDNSSQDSTNSDTVTENSSYLPFPTDSENDRSNNSIKLFISFVFFIIAGSANAVFMKLQAIPMYNYPNFLNLFGCVAYIPLCYLYVIPAAKVGMIPQEQFKLPKAPFAIMGLLDCVVGLMTTFASVQLPGPLLVLLPQAAIPISMAFSKRYLHSTYDMWQYFGAVIVILGILLVLEPSMSNRHAADYTCVPVDEIRDCTTCQAEITEKGCLSHRYGISTKDFLLESLQQPYLVDDTELVLFNNDDSSSSICRWEPSTHDSSGAKGTLIWSGVLVLSCVPMALSSIYKERALGRTEVDAVYLNAWVAIFQTIFSLAFLVPAGFASIPPVLPKDIPSNMLGGLKCYLGIGTIEEGCHPDDLCDLSPLFVNVFVLVNFLYTNFFILVLKYGSANILFLALTVIVPIGNLTFALPFMPNPSVLHLSDILGLGVILSGIVSYRFGSSLFRRKRCSSALTMTDDDNEGQEQQEVDVGRDDLTEPLLHPALQSEER